MTSDAEFLSICSLAICVFSLEKRIQIFCVLAAQLCPTLCDPVDYTAHQALLSLEFQGKNTGVGSHSLLQGIFPTQGSCTAGRFLTMWTTREAHLPVFKLFIVASEEFFSDIGFENYFFLFCGFSFHFRDNVFWHTKVVNFDEVKFVYFLYDCLSFWCHI